MNRRDLMKMAGLGGVGTLLGGIGSVKAEPVVSTSTGGLPPLTIRSVKAIATAPQGANLVLVKVETSEPGLYGIGCATFTQRAEVVVTAINSKAERFSIPYIPPNIL